MKKYLSVLLSTLLLLSSLTAALSLTVFADDPLPAPTFIYDFSKGLTDEIVDPGNRIQMSYRNEDGYVTFIAEGDDPYFRFADGYEPNVTTENLAYAAIKYRTTAAISSGEFFTNRRSGSQWGGPGTHVDWSYCNDGNWHAVVVDATPAWGATTGDSLYAFRFDPLASGAESGDTIDIAYIAFFADKDSAIDYASAEFPDDFKETEPPVEDDTFTIRFNVDGITIYTMTYKKGGEGFREPVVPNRPGYVGVWEAYTLSDKDLVVNAIYTPDETSDTAPDLPPDTESESQTESVSETDTKAETDTSATADSSPDSTAVDETQTEDTGCASSLAVGTLLLLGVAGYTVCRKKDH